MPPDSRVKGDPGRSLYHFRKGALSILAGNREEPIFQHDGTTLEWKALEAELICRLPEATVSEVLRKAATLLSK